VRTKKQVIGRTPISIRFKPGSTYELTFVKSGYLTVRRPLAVRPGKPGTLAVALKKAPPAPTLSLTQRLRQRLLPGR
jgi:PEGA domain